MSPYFIDHIFYGINQFPLQSWAMECCVWPYFDLTEKENMTHNVHPIISSDPIFRKIWLIMSCYLWDSLYLSVGYALIAHNPHLDIAYLTYTIVTMQIAKKCGLCRKKCGLCREKCGLCREKCGLRDYVTHTYWPIRSIRSDVVWYKAMLFHS